MLKTLLVLAIFSFPHAARADGSPVSAFAKSKAATVDCAPGAKCSPSIGMLSLIDGGQASQCSASLVAPDIIATNGHCVPEDLRQPGASCAGRAWMNFVSAEGFESQIECESVLFVEKVKTPFVQETPDYAFYRLKTKSLRPFLRVSRAGFADGEAVNFERVDPVKAEGKIYGVQYPHTCTAIQHSLTSIAATRDNAPIVMVADCPTIWGNSGSPLIGRDGTIRGVIQAKEGVTAAMFKAKKLTQLEPLARHGFGTNYACAKLPPEVNAPPVAASCALPLPRNLSYSKLDAARDAAGPALSPEVRRALGGTWDKLECSRELQRFEPFTVKFRPACVNAAAVGPSASITSGAMRFQIQGSIDKYARVTEAHLVPTTASDAGFLLNAAESGGYRMEAAGLSLNLPVCP
ncbi:MAG: serine protease [Proteobacteria bacterium]|nr:MAG: serine protease [Pseudomonadota bacterium]